ncbi:MAG: 2-dehydropantoate 2-reductase [Methanosaeta sp. PtaU1.Bin112]|nr:MAG: 2-dehydropantoate 2-reductase [Methanosaeta sp. PtaU1.Bin112]
MADILIYGAGAIGSLMGYLLSDPASGSEGMIENVALLGRKSHIKAISELGLRLSLLEKKELLHFKYCFSDLADLKANDFYPNIVIVCVKTYSLSAVCDELKRSGLLQERLKDAIFILLMNGMGNRESFGELGLLDSQVFEGITIMGVKFSEDGMVELKGKGKTIIEAKIDEGLGKFMAERFKEKGFEIEFSPDFKEHQYSKLFANAVINPITALTRRENGVVLAPILQNTVQSVVREAVTVAAFEGIRREERSVLDMVISVAEKTSANTSSMLQDMINGRNTEIDSINGYIIRQARKHKIEVPVNEALCELVKSAAGSSSIG